MKQLNREAIRRMVGDAGMSPGAVVVSGSGGSGGGGGGGTADYATNAGHADTADEATTAQNLAANSTDWQKIADKTIAQTIAEVWTFAKGIISTLRSYFNGGATISKASGDTGKALVVAGGTQTDTMDASGNATVGGTLGVTGKTTLNGGLDVTGDATVGGTLGVTGKLTGADADFEDVTAENLVVTKEAHFFKLVVDEMAANKGAIIVSSANCVAEIVTESTDYYDVYFSKTDKNGRSVVNPWMLYDQALCLTFTGQAGAFSDNNVKNRYYWRVVTGVTEDANYPDYHHIRLSKHAGYYDGTTAPAAGDEIVQLGYRGSASGTEYRKSAVILSSYPTMDAGVTPPSLAFYKGINDFSLSTHRYTYIDGLNNEFIGNFRVLVNGSYQNLATLLVTMEGLISNVQATMLVGNMFGNLTSGWKYLPDGGASRSTTPVMGWFGTSSDFDAILSPNVTLTAGKTYCLSFYSEINGVFVSLYSQNGTLIRNLSYSGVGGGDTFNNQERYYVTFQVQTTGVYYLSFYDSEGQTYLVGMPMLEEGTSPSPVIMYSSVIAQTANQIDINVTSKLGQAGVNIDGSTREINLIAGKVNFLTSGGQTNPKISIDPTTGALNAVDGSFSGIVRASTLYRSFMTIPIVNGMAGLSGSVLTLSTYLTSIGSDLPDVMFFYTSVIVGCYVYLPEASAYQGKVLQIYGMYDWSGYKLVNVCTYNANGVCYITGVGSDVTVRFNNTSGSQYQTGFVTMLSAYDASTPMWKWHILDSKNAEIISS